VKTFIRLELWGEDSMALEKLDKMMFDSFAPGLWKEFVGPTNGPSSWVAEITGFDKKYKYQRTFLKGKKDYSESNSKGSRGIFAEYILESGHIYDIKSQYSNKGKERYFCTVDDLGNIIYMKEKEVIECLKLRSALMCIPQQNSAYLMCLTTSPVSTYHLVGEKTAP